MVKRKDGSLKMDRPLIDKNVLWQKISNECHYNTADPLKSYSKLLEIIQNAPVVNAVPVLTKQEVLDKYGVTYIANFDPEEPAYAEFVDLIKNLTNNEDMFID